MRNYLLRDWRAGRLNQLDFASTPLTFWADVAIMAGFESIWDLLMRDPTLEAQRLANPIPLERWEFWMNETDDKTLLETGMVRREATREQSTTSGPKLDVLTQGAWRTLDMLLFMADRASGYSFLGSSFEPLVKPLSILFSFPSARYGHEKHLLDAEEYYTERLDVAFRLLHYLCTYAMRMVSRDSLYQSSAHLMVHWSQSDLDQFCVMAQSLTAFHDICFTHLHLLCYPSQPLHRYLYGENMQPCRQTLLGMLAWECNVTLSRNILPLSDVELQYRCLSIKWFLLRLSGDAELIYQGTQQLSAMIAEMESAFASTSSPDQPAAIHRPDWQAGLELIQNEMRLHHC